jgi:hypothetical protein
LPNTVTVAHGIANDPAALASGRRALRRFEHAEHGFQFHDGRGGKVAALAQAGLQQVVRELALGFAHVLDEDALALERRRRRDEMPLEPFVALKRQRRFLPLLWPSLPGTSSPRTTLPMMNGPRRSSIRQPTRRPRDLQATSGLRLETPSEPPAKPAKPVGAF